MASAAPSEEQHDRARRRTGWRSASPWSYSPGVMKRQSCQSTTGEAISRPTYVESLRRIENDSSGSVTTSRHDAVGVDGLLHVAVRAHQPLEHAVVEEEPDDHADGEGERGPSSAGCGARRGARRASWRRSGSGAAPAPAEGGEAHQVAVGSLVALVDGRPRAAARRVGRRAGARRRRLRAPPAPSSPAPAWRRASRPGSRSRGAGPRPWPCRPGGRRSGSLFGPEDEQRDDEDHEHLRGAEVEHLASLPARLPVPVVAHGAWPPCCTSVRRRASATCSSPKRATSAPSSRADSAVPRSRATMAAPPKSSTSTGTAQTGTHRPQPSSRRPRCANQPSLLQQLVEAQQVVVGAAAHRPGAPAARAAGSRSRPARRRTPAGRRCAAPPPCSRSSCTRGTGRRRSPGCPRCTPGRSCPGGELDVTAVRAARSDRCHRGSSSVSFPVLRAIGARPRAP